MKLISEHSAREVSVDGHRLGGPGLREPQREC